MVNVRDNVLWCVSPFTWKPSLASDRALVGSARPGRIKCNKGYVSYNRINIHIVIHVLYILIYIYTCIQMYIYVHIHMYIRVK